MTRKISMFRWTVVPARLFVCILLYLYKNLCTPIKLVYTYFLYKYNSLIGSAVSCCMKFHFVHVQSVWFVTHKSKESLKLLKYAHFVLGFSLMALFDQTNKYAESVNGIWNLLRFHIVLFMYKNLCCWWLSSFLFHYM